MYFEALPKKTDGAPLDDQTWRDLDLDQVFELLNRCLTAMGSQVLYTYLKQPLDDVGQLFERRDMIDRLGAEKGLREAAQLAMFGARRPDSNRVIELLYGDLPDPILLSRVAPIMTVCALLCVVLAGIGTISWAWILPVFLVNTIVHFVHKEKIDLAPLIPLAAMLESARRMTTIRHEDLSDVQESLNGPVAKTGRLRRRLAALGTEDRFGLVQYLKIYLVTDVLAFVSAIDLIRSQRQQLQKIFEVIGHVDALLAVASFLDGRACCRPCFDGDERQWEVSGVRHPLVVSPVPNSFSLTTRSALITGSNMSGKTTFLKTVGLNAIFAQTFGFALAENYTVPFVDVVSSIGRADNIVEGRSYYLAEVESILRLVRVADSERRALLLADEIFRGTNSDERIAGSVAVLRYLSNGQNLVFAATHDLGLVQLLEDEYASFHFTESIDATGLSFDYQIRPGHCCSRNAISLLEYAGYPEELVKQARSLILG